ncbi:MAG: hypothetical protein LBL90_03820, partial [Prevotellaceae bacterium]|nr:hypothetical protein [Prevotellaceae bacterium]
MQQHNENLNSAMETETIQKNGVNLKSHKRSFSKTFLFSVVFMYSVIALTAQEIKLKQEYFPDGKIKVERAYEKGSTTNFVSKRYYDNGAVLSESYYIINEETIAEMSDIWTKEKIEDKIEACSDPTRIKYFSKEGGLTEEIEVVGKEYLYKKYYKSGKLAETGHKAGASYTNARRGLVKGYYESGKSKYEENYIAPGESKDGKQIYWYETGEKEGEGNYTAGAGTHTNYYRSGKVKFERSYRDGKKDGVEKAYYESGKPEYEVNYKDDLLDGKEIYWYETGEKEGEGNYTAGTGTHANYYRSGKVKFERSYRDGKKDGVEKAYYESGKPKYEIAYKDDLYNGKTIYWYETGEKEGEGNYTAGTGTHANYYRSGKVEFERSYKDGKKDGV